MISTLILLYALDTGNIPTGCYVAAWTLSILEAICKISVKCIDSESEKEHKP